MKENALIIINPNAGQKKANRYLVNIIGILTSSGYLCTVVSTTKEENAQFAIEKFSDNISLVVCIGGDGTFNEVVSGIVNNKLNIPLGYIPAGSTNDFANGLGLSKNIIRATEDIVNGKLFNIDAGQFNGRVFTYVASCGAFSDTSYLTPTDLKNTIGHTAYILEGIKSLPAIKPVRMKIKTETFSAEDSFIFAAICNSTSIGGILKLDKKIVKLNDGMFEALLIKNPESMGEITKIIHYINIGNYNNELINIVKGSNIEIECEENIDWSLDGEPAKNIKNVKINVLKSAFKLKLKNPK